MRKQLILCSKLINVRSCLSSAVVAAKIVGAQGVYRDQNDLLHRFCPLDILARHRDERGKEKQDCYQGFCDVIHTSI